jgi:hypothetical protein
VINKKHNDPDNLLLINKYKDKINKSKYN